MRNLSLSLMSAALLSACSPSAMMSSKPASAFDPLTAAGKSLDAQNLEIGQCGLFLWGQGEGRPLQFFQNTASKQVRIPFRPASKITRTSSDKQVVDGFFAEQSFDVDGLTMQVSLRVAEGRNVIKGIAVPAGRIVLGEASGRETVIPVIGLFGCRS